jgi:hypothetical protein
MPVKLRLEFIIVPLLLALPHPGHAYDGTSRIWFSPDDETPDLLEMFMQPDLWQTARSNINVYKLGPRHFDLHSSLKRNSLLDLESVSAFEKLKDWGISLATEEGAIKEWDCTGIKAAQVTLTHIQNVRVAHGNIKLIAMDEPLVSGFGACKLSLREIAKNTDRYANDVTRASGVDANSEAPLIGDIEPYPSIPVTTLISWIEALSGTSTRLNFFHLDIDLNYLNAHPEIAVTKDLRELQQLLRQKGIPFGIIIWSGHDPVDSDTTYYKDAMVLVHLVTLLARPPTEIVFQSWVRRSPIGCSADHGGCEPSRCSAGDPSFCGDKSVPLNLPEGNVQSYSHTRLVNDSLAILRGH